MGFLKKLFGDKASRDNKALQPILQKTLKAYEQIVKLDIDSLRHKTVEFKEYIKNKTAAEVAEIAELKAKAEANFDMSPDEKEKLYNQIDKLEKQELDHIEEALNEILPEAFSVVARQHRGRQGLLQEQLDGWRQHGDLGHGALRLPNHRWYGAAPRQDC